MIALFLLLLGCGEDVEPVLAGLDSENPAIREDAVLDARELDDERITARLEQMLHDEDPKIRLEVVLALDAIGSATSVQPLITVVTDPDPAVARAAIGALGRLKDPAAGSVLLAALQTADKPPLDIIWALGQCKVAEARPVLAALRRHDDRWVRYNADVALRTLDE